MRLAASRLLDSLCGEYMVGTLRGAARRRFERALHEEPAVAQRLRHWHHLIAPRYAKRIEIQPSASLWRRLEREIGLNRYRTPWHQRAGFWRNWAVGATAALLVALGLQLARQDEPRAALISELVGDAGAVSAHLSTDGRTLRLRSSRPVIAGPAQSYELWVLTLDGTAFSLAVLGSLDAHFELPQGHRQRLREGGKLAVTVEPAGGAPGGKPTGPVILAGPIKL